MIVVDTSVAVKWIVAEPHQNEALSLFDLAQPRIAPDLLFPELAYVLRKKVLRREISRDQMRAGLTNAPNAFAQLIPSVSLLDAAMTFAESLNHSAYDAFFLACAVGRGVLVTADLVFVRKCEKAGLGASVFALGSADTELAAKLAQIA